MHRAKYRCQRVRPNNGIIEVFFTRIDGVQDEHVLINIVTEKDQYKVGQYYWLTIEPAFPH